MSVINLLSPHVADLIAAGEVVERPASVIKELMENSLDAGAKNITVELRGGGIAYIRVTDDGVGMLPEDAGVAFLRHATSKLHDAEGLNKIGTMGFRGEALAAISGVSHIELTTRRRGTGEGVKVTLTAGEIDDMITCGCPEGTTMVVRDLFYNTPARLKFLKTDRSEASACTAAALRCALGHPEVSVRLIRDGQEEFFSPGDGRIDSAIYTLLGREAASSLLKCSCEDEGMSVRGYTSSPSAGRGNRSMQFFYCNGRYIKSQLLQTAVEQAYKNTLLTGRYPSCVLFLSIDLTSVDVNVHPAKTEVKFTNEKKVFDLVYRAVGLALSGESVTAKPELSPSTVKVSTPRADFFRTMSAQSFRENGYSAAKTAAPVMRAAESDYISKASSKASVDISVENSVDSVDNSADIPSVVFVTQKITPDTTSASAPSDETASELLPKKDGSAAISAETPVKLPVNAVDNSVESVENLYCPPYKIVGEAMKTYIIAESEGQLVLIDKHAAHERIIFDRLKADQGEISSQMLLIPVTVKPDGENAEIIEKNGALLYELGFEIEEFGADSFVIRSVPADMDAGDAAAALEEICEKLRRGKGLDAKSVRDEILHTVACKAAIKAGWDTEPQELDVLVKQVLSGKVKYCPHGRPVAVTLTKKELDKMFKRIV
ncbi:MAG: DNA mismatch repair endonuclease MutL [Eubacteriales bacterium]|nr:DNA mismatch repair endonuclease MutL [Eubacteriales bacterium]